MTAAEETLSEMDAPRSRTSIVMRWLLRRANLVLGAVLVGLIVIVAIFAPMIATAQPDAQDLMNTLSAPSAIHWFGTDNFGRDIFSRVVYGARISLLEVVISVGISCLVGVPLGLIAGTLGKRADQIIMWIMDILFAFPGIILAILLVSVLGASLFNMMLAIAIFSIPVYARLSRNVSLGLKEMEYVEAATALGASIWRVMFDHILRNSLGPIIVQSTLTAGTVVLAAASLSFLGLGAQPPTPEWGAMMSDGRNFLGVNVYLSLFPGLAVTVMVLGFNILGDGLRDLLDPRS
ncbi:ABC transporter permease [Consotaella salsifontis]|uniref:Glutathione transport system permease protein n=1 Tax=Consotaella salsifontis TaxID=1365950 RepID=A0A1T4SPA7_9HYPH|nr:ABC transporter permease [Consotaella salsifontis]SKA29996.1 glutathione transport system permease protein [Consotaella salsifontis]